MRSVVEFFRRNPQALALLIICVILGIGTFIAVIISIAGSSNHSGPGYPNGSVPALQTLVAVVGR
jgi:hypothetical protein